MHNGSRGSSGPTSVGTNGSLGVVKALCVARQLLYYYTKPRIGLSQRNTTISLLPLSSLGTVTDRASPPCSSEPLCTSNGMKDKYWDPAIGRRGRRKGEGKGRGGEGNGRGRRGEGNGSRRGEGEGRGGEGKASTD